MKHSVDVVFGFKLMRVFPCWVVRALRTEHFEWISLERRPLIIEATPILSLNPSSSHVFILLAPWVGHQSIYRKAKLTYIYLCTFVVGFFFNDTTSGVCLAFVYIF